MRISYFVNTMVLVEGTSSRVLFDPWVTFDHPSISDFYNFPESRLSPSEVAAIRPDFIYLTHSHPDHFDPATLRLLGPRTPVLIAKFGNPFFKRAIARVGFTDIREVDPDHGLALNGSDRIWAWPARTYPDVDSIALVEIDGKRVVNANDNPFHEEQCTEIRRKFGRIDAGLIPYAAHGPYPMFYDSLSDSEKARKATEREKRAYQSFTRYVAVLGVEYAIPFAAGLITGGPKAKRYIYSGIGTRSKAVEHALQSVAFKPVLLSEGCSYDLDRGAREGEYVERTFHSEGEYVERISRLKGRFDPGGRFHIADSEQIDLSQYLAMAREKQRKWQTIKGVESDAVFYIDTGQDRLYRLCLANDEVTRTREQDIRDEKYEIFRMPYALLVGLLTRHYNWSNVKSQYIYYYRSPDVFDSKLHLMMSFLHL